MSRVTVGDTSTICDALHRIIRPLPRHHFEAPGDHLPDNGIYFVFEEGEAGHAGDRIVRVGSHTGDGNLRARLQEHVTPNKDRSIFRKNLGRCLLRREADPYMSVWEIDFTSPDSRERFGHLRDEAKQISVEDAVSAYITRSMRFAVVPFEGPEEALRVERLAIATIANCGTCGPSTNWLGRHSPSDKIVGRGMWQQQHLRGEPFSVRGLEDLSKRVGHRRNLATSELRICELIPGERILSRESIDRWKDNIAAGNIVEPIVVRALDGYYVTQGNHRVFAAKEMGQLSVACRIAQVIRQANVEAQDDIDCTDALKAGLLGFNGLKVVATDRDREQACEEEASEDDPIFEDLLGDIEI